MKYKALLSPTQSFSFGGRKYQAINGELITDDKELIKYLDNNKCWESKTKKSSNELKDQEKKEAKAELKADKKAE